MAAFSILTISFVEDCQRNVVVTFGQVKDVLRWIVYEMHTSLAIVDGFGGKSVTVIVIPSRRSAKDTVKGSSVMY